MAKKSYKPQDNELPQVNEPRWDDCILVRISMLRVFVNLKLFVYDIYGFMF